MKFVSGAGIANLDILYSGVSRIPNEGEEIYSNQMDIQMGGGVPATLINLATLGVPVNLFTMLGNDMFSKIVEQKLLTYNVAYKNLYEGNQIAVTVTSVMITDTNRTFVSYNDKIIITDQMRRMVYEGSKGAKIIQMHIGYIEVYKKLKAYDNSIIFVFDTGWDDDLSFEKFREYIELADYYTPNTNEALKITGKERVEDAVLELNKYFDKVILKLDKDGCLVRSNNKNYLVPAMSGVIQKDSTGAGDAFLSGVIYGLFYDYDILDCVSYGNVCGGYCVQEIGCLGKFPTREQLHKEASKIRESIRCISE